LKLLITGANGLFGSKLAQMALQRGIEVYSSDLEAQSPYGTPLKLDVSNKTQVDAVFERIKPDVVVHAAALTDVDKCELNKGFAWKVNVDGTMHIREASEREEAFLMYLSTDYVFSGEKGCYVESDAADPQNYYGLTKLIAEEIVQTIPEFFIARPSVIYGTTPAAGKTNFALWLIETLHKGERVQIVKDQWNTPTLNTNLAEMVLEAAERRLVGLYHLCGATKVTRIEFAKAIANTFDLDKRLIDKVASSQFSWLAKRPLDSSLDTSLAQRVLKSKPLPLEAALAQLKTELNQTWIA